MHRFVVLVVLIVSAAAIFLMSGSSSAPVVGSSITWERGWDAAKRAIGSQNQTALAAAMRVDAEYRRCKGSPGGRWNDAAMACEY